MAKATPSLKGSAKSLKSPYAKFYTQAEGSCNAWLDQIQKLSDTDFFDKNELARQYAQMVLVYHKKIRNGRVLSPEDYNLAVSLNKAANKLLPLINIASNPFQAEVMPLTEQTQQTLNDFETLKALTKKR